MTDLQAPLSAETAVDIDADAAAFETARREGRFADAITIATRLLTVAPTRAEIWIGLRQIPLYDHADVAGIAHWMPITRNRAAEIIQGLLNEVAQHFHPIKLLVASDLARTCNVAISVGTIAQTAGIPILVRPLRIMPQDFAPGDIMRVDTHPFQPWVYTHNRPDGHRKNQHPFVPFVRVPGLQVARTPSQEKPENSFILFDGDHGLLAQDTMWAGHNTSEKMLTPLTLNSVMSFGWVPRESIDIPSIFIPNRENYYHFLLESLPAAAIAAKSPEFSAYKLVFSRLSRWQNEALRMAGVPEDRVVELENLKPSLAAGTDYLQFRDAWVPVDLPFALACTVTRWMLPVSRKVKRGARYYISRGGGGHILRRLRNEEEIIAAFEARGFQPVLAERLSFREQVELFASAEIIAGVHGAGLTNALHASEQAWTIELVNSSCVNEKVMNHAAVQRLAQCIGQNYLRIIGADEPEANPDPYKPNRPFRVSVASVMQTIDVIEEQNRYYDWDA